MVLELNVIIHKRGKSGRNLASLLIFKKILFIKSNRYVENNIVSLVYTKNVNIMYKNTLLE